MDDKIRPSSLYTIRKDNYQTYEDIGNADDVWNDNPQWGKDAVVSRIQAQGEERKLGQLQLKLEERN